MPVSTRQARKGSASSSIIVGGSLRGERSGKALHVGEVGAIRVSRLPDDGHRVACGIPGYERVGNEYFADELRVQDDPFDWTLEGNCAYATTFEYGSE